MQSSVGAQPGLNIEQEVYELAKAVRLLAVTLRSSLGALSDPQLAAEQCDVVLELVGSRLGTVVAGVEKIMNRLED